MPKPFKPTLQNLSMALRFFDKGKDFKWSFLETYVENKCGNAGCAMGYTKYLWPEQFTDGYDAGEFISTGVHTAAMQEIFGLSEYVSRDLFILRAPAYYGPDINDVPFNYTTPLMVAEAIDTYLASAA